MLYWHLVFVIYTVQRGGIAVCCAVSRAYEPTAHSRPARAARVEVGNVDHYVSGIRFAFDLTLVGRTRPVDFLGRTGSVCVY